MSAGQDPYHCRERGLVGTHWSELRGNDVQQQTEHLQDERLLPRAAAGAGRYPRHHGHDKVLHVVQLGQGLGGEGQGWLNHGRNRRCPHG